jgi:hypothetical protein
MPITDTSSSIGKVRLDQSEGSLVRRMRIVNHRIPRAVILGWAALGVCGCVGPQAVHYTRSRYNEVIQTSNKEELLLNLVRIRYLEDPGFLPVTGLTAQFEVDAGALGRGGTDRGGMSHYGEGNLRFADRPTITFAPQRSPELTKGLLTRIPLETLFLFVANGADQGRLLRLFVRNINGIDNAGEGGGPTPPIAPEFAEFRYAAELSGRLNRERRAVLSIESRPVDVPGAVPIHAVTADDLIKITAAGQGVRPLSGNNGYMLTHSKPVRVWRVQREALGAPEVDELVRVLRLKPRQETYEIEEVEGQLRPSQDEPARSKLTVTTRSVLEVMFLLSQTINAPSEHVHDALVIETRNPDGSMFDWGQVLGDLFRVEVAKHKPKNAYIAVPYRGYWFYIDDADSSSKITLNLFSELFRLQRISASEGGPLLTLPVGR